MTTIGERIRVARKKMGFTQQELADKMGISFVGISQWESGKRNPKKETLMRLAAVLEVPISYFLDTDTMSSDEVLEFLVNMWRHADYQLTIMQHMGNQQESEQWERICFELHKLHEEIAAKNRSTPKELPDLTADLLEVFQQLNLQGQRKVLAIAGDYAQIPEYLQQPPSE